MTEQSKREDSKVKHVLGRREKREGETRSRIKKNDDADPPRFSSIIDASKGVGSLLRS